MMVRPATSATVKLNLTTMFDRLGMRNRMHLLGTAPAIGPIFRGHAN